jgi:hypothetical protein
MLRCVLERDGYRYQPGAEDRIIAAAREAYDRGLCADAVLSIFRRAQTREVICRDMGDMMINGRDRPH